MSFLADMSNSQAFWCGWIIAMMCAMVITLIVSHTNKEDEDEE